MEKTMILLKLLLVGVGFVLMIIARLFRVAGEPFASFNPKYWKPMWKMKDKYHSPGYELSLIGVILVVVGILLSLIR
jgi:uncharacterized membrane protein